MLFDPIFYWRQRWRSYGGGEFGKCLEGCDLPVGMIISAQMFIKMEISVNSRDEES